MEAFGNDGLPFGLELTFSTWEYSSNDTTHFRCRIAIYPCWPSVERIRHVDPIEQNSSYLYTIALRHPFDALPEQFYTRDR